MTICLICPTRNEAPGLRAILPELQKYRHCVDEIIFVDQDSTDGSWQLILSAGFRLHCQTSKGLMESILEAARLTNCDSIIEFSPDGNCKPEDLPMLCEMLRLGYDCVVVSRYWKSIKAEDNTWWEAIGSRAMCRLIAMLGDGRKVTDTQAIFRGYPRRWLFEPGFRSLLYGPVLEPAVSAYALIVGARYAEVLSSEPKRIGGTSKCRWWVNGPLILWMIVKAWRLKWRFKRGR